MGPYGVKKFRHFYVNLAIIALNTAILFAGLEFIARIIIFDIAPENKLLRFKLPQEWPKTSLSLSPHPYLSYSTTPNYFNYNNGRKEFSHNSLGYRGLETTLKKQTGIFRIVTLGGSTTYTSGVPENSKTYPALLEKELKEKFGFHNIEVINAGVPGYTSWESLINFQFRVLELDPDLIIIYHGTNDTHARLVPPSAYHGDNLGSRKHWENPAIPFWEQSVVIRFFSRLKISSPPSDRDFTGAKTAFQSGPNPLQTLKANPPVYFKRNISSIVAIAKQNNIGVMLATWASSSNLGYANLAHYKAGFSDTVNVIKEIGSQYSVPVFNFHEKMPEDGKYWIDGIHVNERGSALKAHLFARFISEEKLVSEKFKK